MEHTYDAGHAGREGRILAQGGQEQCGPGTRQAGDEVDRVVQRLLP
jgi:hypothetical protein